MRASIERTLLWAALLLLALNINANTLFVDSNGTNPVPPFVDWSTVATNIQDAIDASSDGDTVLVTNGVYATGGRSMDGVITNRVSLNKAITVQSVNGPLVTTILGSGAPNEPAAIRFAHATLIGFTLKWGATRTSGSDSVKDGAVFGTSLNLAQVSRCIIVSNNAFGPTAYQVSGQSSLLTHNAGTSVANLCVLNNCSSVSRRNHRCCIPC